MPRRRCFYRDRRTTSRRHMVVQDLRQACPRASHLSERRYQIENRCSRRHDVARQVRRHVIDLLAVVVREKLPADGEGAIVGTTSIEWTSTVHADGSIT